MSNSAPFEICLPGTKNGKLTGHWYYFRFSCQEAYQSCLPIEPKPTTAYPYRQSIFRAHPLMFSTMAVRQRLRFLWRFSRVWALSMTLTFRHPRRQPASSTIPCMAGVLLMLHLHVARTVHSRRLLLALVITAVTLTSREMTSQAILSAPNHSLATELAVVTSTLYRLMHST